MIQKRLLYSVVWLVAFLAIMPQIHSMEADVAEDAAKGLMEDVSEDALRDSDMTAEKLQADLEKALRGTSEDLKNFMKKNKSFFKDSEAFDAKFNKVADQQAAALKDVKADKVEDLDRLAGRGEPPVSGEQPPSGEEPPSEELPSGEEPPSGEEAPPSEEPGKEPADTRSDYDKGVDAGKKLKAKYEELEAQAKAAGDAGKQTFEKATPKSLEDLWKDSKATTQDLKDQYGSMLDDEGAISKTLDNFSEDDLKSFAKDSGLDPAKINSKEDLLQALKEKLSGAKTQEEAFSAAASIKSLDNLKGLAGDLKGLSPADQSALIKENTAVFKDFDGEVKNGTDFSEQVDSEAKDAAGQAKKESKLKNWTQSRCSQATENFTDSVRENLDSDWQEFKNDPENQQLFDDVNKLSRLDKIKNMFSIKTPEDIEEMLGKEKGRLASMSDKVDSALSTADDGLLKKIGHKGLALVEMLFSAVLFMVPNIFQSTFLAAQQKAAAMASWGRPVKFGGKVWQIPDACINLDNPAASWPIYVQIPVADVGDDISSDVAALYNNLISGPTTNNPLSEAIHSGSTRAFSFFSTYETTISRYNIDPKYLELADIVVVYSAPGGYVTTGSVAMNSSEFTGQLVSLRTGQVIDATGDTVDATGLSSARGVPLIPVTQWGALNVPQNAPINTGLQALNQTLPGLLAKEEVAGSKVTFTEYSNTGSGSSGTQLSSSMQSLLDTECIDSNGSLKKTDCPCVLVDGLEAQAAGLFFGQGGSINTVFKMLNPQQFLKKAEAANIPIEKISVIGKKGTLIDAGSSSPIAVTAGISSRKLGRLSDPVSLTSSGTSGVTSSNVPPAASSGWSGLGSVIPIFGWGTNDRYDQIITSTAFPGFDPSQLGISGIQKVGSIVKDNLTQVAKGTAEENTVFADEDTLWASKGCWIYLSTQTPFAQYIQQGLKTTPSLTGPYVDYIVFLDDQGNIIPMMEPLDVEIEAADGTTYKKGEMYLNPAVKYWTSLIGYNLSDFAQDGQAVMYDLQGNAYAYANLGALASAPAASQGTPSGIIPTFLTGQAGISAQPEFAELYNQFQIHSAALIARMNNMPIPYANCSLSADAEHAITLGTGKSAQSVATYSGMNCWESSVGDLLVPVNDYPLGNNSEFLTLPNSEAQYAVSLITDIAYQLTNNAWVPVDFTNSPLNLDSNNNPVKTGASYSVNASMENNFYFLSGIYGSATIPTALQSFITQSRTSWIKNLAASFTLGTGANAIVCTLAQGLSSKYAAANKAYIYQLSPSPSAAIVDQQDYFVAVNTSTPSLSTAQPINIEKAGMASSAVLVSLLSGTLYDMNGNPISHKNGLPKHIALAAADMKGGKSVAEVIFNKVSQIPALPVDFKKAYKSSVDQFVIAEAQPQGPYAFGKYQVAIRTGDLNSGTFVYFSAAGMHKSNFVPRDLYVILSQTSSGFSLDQYDTSKTQFLLSVVTGIAYDQNGQIAMTLPASNLANKLQVWSVGWSPWIKASLKQLQDDYAARNQQYEQDAQDEQSRIDSFISKHDAAQNKNKASIAAIITRLDASQPLDGVFGTLKYDQTSGQYVHMSPLPGTSANPKYVYLFLGSGDVYHEDGSYVSQYSPTHLTAVRNQLGVVVDPASGVQKLGVPSQQPSLLMSQEDEALKVGSSGQTLIVSTDSDFPGEPVKLASGYYLYFSKLMDTYYVYSSEYGWMSVDGGHVYEQNGAPFISGQKVAMVAGAKNDFMLLKPNSQGFIEGFMSNGSAYANISSSNTTMSWQGVSEPYNDVTVTANSKGTLYTIGTKKYAVADAYTWYNLLNIPIDSTGALVANSAAPETIQIVMQGKAITNVLFNGKMYTVGAATGSTYVLQEYPRKSKETISIEIDLVDADTKAPYVVLQVGSDEFVYGYQPLVFNEEQQDANRANIWKGSTAPAPMPLAVGPMHQATKTVGGASVTVTVPDYQTHVLFAKDLPATKGVINAPVAVAPKTVQKAPSAKVDPVGYESLQLGLINVYQTSDNRFVCAIGGATTTNQPGLATYSYVANPAYVDLKTGAVYDAEAGIATGLCLNRKDFLALLDACHVCVQKQPTKGTGKAKDVLVYRDAQVIQAETAQAEGTINAQESSSTAIVTPPSSRVVTA